jgi:hypothetical protein
MLTPALHLLAGDRSARVYPSAEGDAPRMLVTLRDAARL